MPSEDYDYTKYGMFGYPWDAPVDADVRAEQWINRYDDEAD